MKLAACASRLDLDAEASPKRVCDRGPARARDLRVRNDGVIGRQFASARVEERDETWAADLLFALEETGDIHRQPACCLQERLDRFHMREHLSFIVARASSIDVVAANDRLEGRRKP